MVFIQYTARGTKFDSIKGTNGSAPFVVHEDVLTYHSPSFRAALHGSSEEATSKVVRVEASNRIVELFVHWLYYQCPPIEHDDQELLKSWRDGYFYNLTELHAFCEKYEISAMKRQTIDPLYDLVANKCLPIFWQIYFAFDLMPSKLPLYQLLVGLYCTQTDKKLWQMLWDSESRSLRVPTASLDRWCSATHRSPVHTHSLALRPTSATITNTRTTRRGKNVRRMGQCDLAIHALLVGCEGDS